MYIPVLVEYGCRLVSKDIGDFGEGESSGIDRNFFDRCDILQNKNVGGGQKRCCCFCSSFVLWLFKGREISQSPPLHVTLFLMGAHSPIST